MKKVMGVLAIVLAVFVAGAADSFTRTRPQADANGADGFVDTGATGYVDATQDGVTRGAMLAVYKPMSCSHFQVSSARQGTDDGVWFDTGLGRQAYRRATLTISGDSGDNSATRFLYGWNGATPLIDSQDGVQIGGALVGPQVLELSQLPRWIKLRTDASTATTYDGFKFCE